MVKVEAGQAGHDLFRPSFIIHNLYGRYARKLNRYRFRFSPSGGSSMGMFLMMSGIQMTIAFILINPDKNELRRLEANLPASDQALEQVRTIAPSAGCLLMLPPSPGWQRASIGHLSTRWIDLQILVGLAATA